MENLKKVFGGIALFTAILVVVHWGIVEVENWVPAIWILADIIFIIMPVLYILMVCGCMKKSADTPKPNLNLFLLTPLVVISLLTLFQLFTGKFGVDDKLWDYIDALVIVTYSFIAGSLANCCKCIIPNKPENKTKKTKSKK